MFSVAKKTVSKARTMPYEYVLFAATCGCHLHESDEK